MLRTCRSYKLSASRYVEDGAGSIAEIVRRLELHEIRAGAISVARPSLDDVFLKATGRRLEGRQVRALTAPN